MRVFKKLPRTECIIAETGTHEYEFFLIIPVSLGGARWTGTQRIVTDDGHQFTNLVSAQRYFLDVHNEAELVKSTKLRVKNADRRAVPEQTKTIPITTRELIQMGAWFKFAEPRKIPASALSQVDKSYDLTEKEAKELGLL